MSSGFEITASQLMIEKDVEAVLTYAFDWVDWLPTGDELNTVEYTVQARVNDPYPVVITNHGTYSTFTFVELSGGQINKSYKITAKITTANGLIDRRNFVVNVTNRSG